MKRVVENSKKVECLLKRGSAIIVIGIVLMTVILAFISVGKNHRSPINNGVYLSKSIDVNHPGQSGFGWTNSMLRAMDLSLEYTIRNGEIDLKVFSEGELLDEHRFGYSTESNNLILDNGMQIAVSHKGRGYELAYPDYSVIVKPK